MYPTRLLDSTTGTSRFVALLFATLCISRVLSQADYQSLALSKHNSYRYLHSARPLRPSNDLNKRAVKCAEYYIDLGEIDHSCPFAGRFGENIWANYGGTPSTYNVVTRSVDGWYSEESFYKYGGSQAGTGHFTQMVWQASKEFGFGIARSSKRRMTVAVALYNPPGNFIGEYGMNVERPRKRSLRSSYEK